MRYKCVDRFYESFGSCYNLGSRLYDLPAIAKGNIIEVNNPDDENFQREGPVVNVTPRGTVDVNFEDHTKEYNVRDTKYTGRDITNDELDRLPKHDVKRIKEKVNV